MSRNPYTRLVIVGGAIALGQSVVSFAPHPEAIAAVTDCLANSANHQYKIATITEYIFGIINGDYSRIIDSLLKLKTVIYGTQKLIDGLHKIIHDNSIQLTSIANKNY